MPLLDTVRVRPSAKWRTPRQSPPPPATTYEQNQPTASAEADEDRSAFGIFLNPLYALFGRYELNLAYSPTHLVAINATGAYYDISSSAIKMKIYGGDLGVQFFLSGHRPMHGAYVYPRGVYYSAEATDGTTNVNVTIYGTAVTGGYQWNWQPFSLRIGGGVVYYVASGQSDSSSVKVTLNGAAPMLDANIGFVF